MRAGVLNASTPVPPTALGVTGTLLNAGLAVTGPFTPVCPVFGVPGRLALGVAKSLLTEGWCPLAVGDKLVSSPVVRLLFSSVRNSLALSWA